MAYSLYRTFNDNIPEKDLNAKDTKELIKVAENLNTDQKVAFVRLILEHSRLTNGEDQKLNDLPYSGIDSDEGVVFDLSRLPQELKWILWRFVNVCKE